MLGLSWIASQTMLTPSANGTVGGEASAWIVASMVIGLVALTILGVHPPGELSDMLRRAAGALGVAR